MARITADKRVLAVLLGGSLAHGYARRDSDIDLMIVVSDREYRRRFRTGVLFYWESQSCSYRGGYIDGKYTSPSFLRKVADHGSEPARYAYHGAKVVFSRMRGLEALLKRVTAYPEKGRESRVERFKAQFEAWKWYYYEALKHRNAYLRNVSTGKLLLFGCRLILARNRSLYPYHKWMLKEVGRQGRLPRGMLKLVERIAGRVEPRDVERFHSLVLRYAGVKKPSRGWPNRFMLDSELNWVDGATPVDDL